MKEIPMPITPNFHILTKTEGVKTRNVIIMSNLTEDEEKTLESIGEVILERGDEHFLVESKNVHCYGEIDFTNQEDVNVIKALKILNHLSSTGIPFVANYDYERHSCFTDNGKIKYGETWNPFDLVQYAHGCLEKPKRVIIFTNIVKK